jgi:hypothetical protein
MDDKQGHARLAGEQDLLNEGSLQFRCYFGLFSILGHILCISWASFYKWVSRLKKSVFFPTHTTCEWLEQAIGSSFPYFDTLSLIRMALKLDYTSSTP